MKNNSRASIFGKSNYVENSAPEPNDWGQPPASHFIFQTRGTALVGQMISGPYIQKEPFCITSAEISAPTLHDEFDAWELASDQDFHDLGF